MTDDSTNTAGPGSPRSGLLACPFCGQSGTAAFGPRIVNSQYGYAVVCACGGSMNDWATKESAIKNWNIRRQANDQAHRQPDPKAASNLNNP